MCGKASLWKFILLFINISTLPLKLKVGVMFMELSTMPRGSCVHGIIHPAIKRRDARNMPLEIVEYCHSLMSSTFSLNTEGRNDYDNLSLETYNLSNDCIK